MTTFKHFRIVLLFCAALPLGSCGSDSTEAAGTTDTSAQTPAAGDDATSSDATVAPVPQESPALPGAQAAPAPAPAPATAAAGVQHYTCPKNCKGSGGPAAGKCPVCGSDYVHNQAFHAQSAPATTPGQTAAPTPSPAKNAAGVFHYTCPKGCAGGAGSAGKCATCGGELAHNTAYHQ